MRLSEGVPFNASTRAGTTHDGAFQFPGQPLPVAQRYSRRLVDGWYVDTNLNGERMRRILPAAVRAAGLTWGEDVKAYWHATQVAAR